MIRVCNELNDIVPIKRQTYRIPVCRGSGVLSIVNPICRLAVCSLEELSAQE